jgi:hypothetical protein
MGRSRINDHFSDVSGVLDGRLGTLLLDRLGKEMIMDISQFLVEVRLNVYTGEGDEEGVILEDGCRELAYSLNEFSYRDRSMGFNPFIGEELVWQAGRLYWGMNYFGKVISENVPSSQVLNFLKQAIRQVHSRRPFRGPDYFRAGSFTYVDTSHRVLDSFTGEEVIYFRDQQVYRLVYHGGRLV